MYQSMIQDSTRRSRHAGERAGQSRTTYTEMLGGFDPGSYMKEAAGATFADLSEDFTGMEARRRESANGSGFMNTGAGQGGQMRDFNSRLARALAGLSMETAGMEQGRIDRYGDLYATDLGQENAYGDQATSLGIAEIQQKAADKASKRSMWGNILGSGLSAAGMALAFSDEELKEEIRPKKDALARVRRMKGVDWRWKGKADRLGLRGDDGGVIAQEVEKIRPGSVEKDAATGYRKVNYTDLVGDLIEATKELDGRLARMEGR